ncbi:MAG: MBOAT family O-acyltransferase [Henriciella sp.]
MIFNSITYTLFLLVVVTLYWFLPRRVRLVGLFAASLTFYGFWSVPFISVMMASVVTDYVAALRIDKARSERVKSAWLYASLIVNLGLLVFFKYYYFLSGNIEGIASMFGYEVGLPYIHIILPIGISFYTFQSISYTLDVRRGFIQPERDFVLFGVYVMFFPQLVAGPILRAREVIPQLIQRPAFATSNIAEGMRRILAGLFLKVGLADQIAPIVDEMYAQDPAYLGAADTLTMAFLFGLQIYFDFSAYSHIALGSAKLMGIEFPENFRFPYNATSPRAFWRRWHISLGSWIRDYIYLPLTGAKVEDRSTGGIATANGEVVLVSQTRARLALALFITWITMGLWHGAGWAFVLWGAWHAIFIQIQRVMPSSIGFLGDYSNKLLAWLITLPIMMLSWIPFRTQDVGQAVELWVNMMRPEKFLLMGFRENAYLVTAVLTTLTLAAPFVWGWVRDKILGRQYVGAFIEVAAISFIAIIVLVYLRPMNQFIYFQF